MKPDLCLIRFNEVTIVSVLLRELLEFARNKVPHMYKNKGTAREKVRQGVILGRYLTVYKRRGEDMLLSTPHIDTNNATLT